MNDLIAATTQQVGPIHEMGTAGICLQQCPS